MPKHILTNSEEGGFPVRFRDTSIHTRLSCPSAAASSAAKHTTAPATAVEKLLATARPEERGRRFGRGACSETDPNQTLMFSGLARKCFTELLVCN